MHLHHGELGVGERTGLEQHRVGNAHLADVVQRRGPADKLHVVRGQRHGARQPAGQLADTARVVARVFVAVLGGARQPVEHLVARLLEFLRTQPDDAFQGAVVLEQLAVQRAGLQQVTDAQHDLDRVERLGPDVAGTQLQGALLDGRVPVARDDEHRQLPDGGQQVLHQLEQGEAVEPGHVQVEDEQVGLVLAQQPHHLERIDGGVDARVAAAVEQARQQRQVLALVVDDEDARCRDGRLGGRNADRKGAGRRDRLGELHALVIGARRGFLSGAVRATPEGARRGGGARQPERAAARWRSADAGRGKG